MENRSLLVEGTWWKNKKTGEIGFITDIQVKKGLIIFRFFQNGHVGSFTNMEFLREFEICPSHPKNVSESNVNNEYDKLQTHAIIPGSIYFNCVGGINVVIPFKEESGVISFIMSDCLNDEVYFTTDIAEFIERYTLYQVFNKPDNGKAFDELVNKTKERYNKIINKINKENEGRKVVKDRIIMGTTWINKKSKEKFVVTRIVDDMVEYCSQPDEIRTMCKECFVDEFEMITHDKSKTYTTSDKDNTSMKMRGESDAANKILNVINEGETYLKTDESKLEDFGTGAKREDKTGKGRYDLIPGDVMSEFEDFAWTTYFMNGATTCSATDVSRSAYFDDWTNVELYYDFIFNMISYFFIPEDDRIECCDDNGELSYEVTWDLFRKGLYDMRKALAKHYEAGAVVHGVDNWKKGLPVYGSARGGCFLDSMRRHTDQALMGKTDEPHAVAAIWNAFGAVWTLKHKPHSAMYQNSSAVKAEEKPKSTHFDMVDSTIDALKHMPGNKSKDFEEKCKEVLNGRYLTSIKHPIGNAPKHMDNDKDHFSFTNVTGPSGKKYTIRKWPEGFEPVVDFNKEAFLKELDNDTSLYNEFVNHIVKIENYHDTKYNIKKTIDVLGKIINNKNFSKRTYLVRQVYFDIYTALVILNDIIACFHEYSYDMIRITKIVSDVQDMINHNVGGVRECCGNITLKWESCPKCIYGYIVCLAETDGHKLNILYETIGRAAHGLLSKDADGFDPFCGLGITQSLLEFNTYCLERRVYK
ncbi:MAG: hypothetical protein IKU29_03830 [Parabacteroides sp.]|nr:hypothetical protein [Parabacteroides sp.]